MTTQGSSWAALPTCDAYYSRQLPAWCAALLVGLLNLPADASAQAWIRPAGQTYSQLTYRLIAADSIYGAGGDEAPLAGNFSQHTLVGYAEVGVLDRWLMLSAGGELFRRSSVGDDSSSQGLGDLTVGAFSGLLEGPVRLSLGAVLGIPTGDAPRAVDQADGTDERLIAASLATGDGEWDVSVLVSLGTFWAPESRWPFVHFAQLSTGPWLRTEGIRHQWRYRAELGFKPKLPSLAPLWVVLRLNGLEVLGPRGDPFEPTASGLGDGVRYLSPGLQVLWQLSNGLGFGVSADGAFFGQNVPRAPAWGVSLSFEPRG